jgi:glycogen synthase
MLHDNGEPRSCMKFSVVINTCDRADSLGRTLRALRHQTHPSFEVVVVNGPSRDHTDEILAEFAGEIRVVACPERHLSKSRNLGIEASAGEVVAFIDDDAIPEPRWLEELDAAYDDEEIAGAGGIVYDHTGAELQYRYSVCDRVGEPRFDVKPPFDRYLRPGADPFVYLQGTNASFRRSSLEEIGGFDEEIEYYLDEVDVCLCLIDSGHKLRSLAGAAVHHHYLPSDIRNPDRVVFDPYSTVKNRLYFALRYGAANRSISEILDEQVVYWNGIRSHARLHRNEGLMTDEQLDRFESRLEEGLEDGLARGLEGGRKSRELRPATEAFKPFPTLRPEGRRLNVCFVSAEYPPGEFGGIGRYTVDLAAGFAEVGHEVHVITTETDQDRVDFEDGVWVHRVVTRNLGLPELRSAPAAWNIYRAATVAHELDRIQESSPIDVVSAPLWASEGCVCMFDRRFPTILTLMTSMHTIAGLHESWNDDPQIEALIQLEGATVAGSKYLHALSDAVLADARKAYRTDEEIATVVPLGTRDASEEYPAQRGNGDKRLRILFVGRLERRKGVDVLLDAAERLLPERPDVELVLVGKDTENTEIGETYRESFQRRFGEADWAERVTFAGAVSDEELFQHYSDCDVFVAPSRYESFGLVLTEAMAFGKPVVGCQAGGMKEVVDDGATGLLAEPGDATSLAEQLAKLIDDPDLRDGLGTAARAAFERQFARPITVERTVGAYRKIAEAFAEKPGGTPEADERAMADDLAGLLVAATGIPAAEASHAAERLVEHPPERQPTEAERLTDDEAYLVEIFEEFLDRPTSREEIAPFLVQLRRGVSRDVIRNVIATSEEALKVAAARGEEPATPEPAPSTPPPAPPTPPAPSTFRQRVRRAPGLGRALLFAKRSLVAPRNTQQAVDQSLRLEQLLGEYTEQLRAEAYHDEIGRYRDHAREEAVLTQLLSTTRSSEEQLAEFRSRPLAHSGDIGEVTGALMGLRNQVEVLQRKQEMLALNLRERVGTEGEAAEPVESRVVDQERYKELTADGAPRINVGCGEKPLPEYLNVDMRQGEGVDIVADASDLPFEPDSLGEVASFHLVEHFREQQLRQTILPHWRSLLRPNGTLRIVCPNWEAMIEQLQAGKMPYKVFKTLTFGLQDYEGDDHFAMYTPASLEDSLSEAGFTDVELVVADRQNGMCPEMELTAKP